MVAAEKNIPEIDMAGMLGAFTDFDQENKRKLVELGLIQLVYSRNDKVSSDQSVGSMYCFWGTLCDQPDAAELMVETMGELERGVMHMKAHTRGNARGEVLLVHSSCFMKTEAMRKRMFEAGMLPEIVRAMRDELS